MKENKVIISYATFKIALGVSGCYYTALAVGYSLYAVVVDTLFISCDITEASDIADFETNIKPYSISCLDEADALVLASILSTQVSRATGYVSTAATTGVAVRATTYSPQGANAQRSIKSSSVNDTAAGTGARTILITYLTAAFILKTETVTLNGTSAVNTVGVDIAYIEKMEVLTVGTQGGGNAGTLSLYTQTAGGGVVWASIAASDNMTYWAHHYVPTGKTCYLLNISGGGTAVAGRITVQSSGNPSNTTAPQIGIGGTYPHISAGNTDHSFSVPIAIPGPNLIWLVDRPNAATASTSYGTFEYIQY